MSKTPREIIQEHKEYLERWGASGFGSSMNYIELLTAATTLLLEEPTQDNGEDLTKVKRQLTAAKAREAKLKKRIDKLESDLRDSQLTRE